MNHTTLAESLAVLLETLLAQARERPELRHALRDVAEWLGQAAVEPPPPTTTPMVIAAPPGPPRITESVPLRVGDATTVVRVSDTGERISAALRAASVPAAPQIAHLPLPGDERHGTVRAGEAVELPQIVQRCQIKAESCLWAITRRRRVAERAEFETAIKPTDDDLKTRATQLPNCRVWAIDPYGPNLLDEQLELASNCYQNMAEAASLTHEIRAEMGDDTFREESYSLLAEAQSALRVLMESLGLKVDHDQNEAFLWLRTRTFEDQVLIQHYMRLSDSAVPAAWMRLSQKNSELRSRYEQFRGRERDRKQWFSKARYHARKLAARPEFEVDINWRTVVAAIEKLVEIGVPPSNTEIRELLLPLVDQMPDDLTGGSAWEQVVAEIDRYIASREPEQPETPAPRTPTPELRRALEFSRGKVAVLIGGQCRPYSQRALERDLELAELRWIPSRAHQSISEFESQVARAEVGLVILAIRWASHSFEGVADMCVKYAKPFVRLPGGYGSNQVAAQIVSQVGGIG